MHCKNSQTWTGQRKSTSGTMAFCFLPVHAWGNKWGNKMVEPGFINVQSWVHVAYRVAELIGTMETFLPAGTSVKMHLRKMLKCPC